MRTKRDRPTVSVGTWQAIAELDSIVESNSFGCQKVETPPALRFQKRSRGNIGRSKLHDTPLPEKIYEEMVNQLTAQTISAKKMNLTQKMRPEGVLQKMQNSSKPEDTAVDATSIRRIVLYLANLDQRLTRTHAAKQSKECAGKMESFLISRRCLPRK